MKIKKIIPIIIVFIIFITGSLKYYSLKEIDKNNIDVFKYIEYADKVSENKVQVNWKYVASIIAVLNNNNFKKVNDSDIKKIAQLFIEEDSSNYKLKKLEAVLDSLNFNSKEKSRVHDYIDDLENYGVKPSSLNPVTDNMNFINDIKKDAIDNYKEYKVLPSITIAQAILESSWGKSRLSKDFNNLFGIKADIYWDGEYVTLETKEHIDTTINDRFRKYNNKNQSINDHARFLSENKRYKNNGVFEAHTYIYQAQALENAGYSTVANKDGELAYADMLINLIRQYNLQLIDSEVQS